MRPRYPYFCNYNQQTSNNNTKNWAFAGPKTPKIGSFGTCPKNLKNCKTLIFHLISAIFFKSSGDRDKCNGAQIKILAKDLEKIVCYDPMIHNYAIRKIGAELEFRN